MKRSCLIILLFLISQSYADDCVSHENQEQIDACKLLRHDFDELAIAFEKRIEMAKFQTIDQKPNDLIENTANGDETRIPKFAANFTKYLEHDSLTGLLTVNGQEQYKKLLNAIRSGLQADYNNINLAPQSLLKFVSPQGSATFSLISADSSLFRIPAFPSLRSKEAAAQLIEVYLQAICRDVSFSDYGTGQNTDKSEFGSITNQASSILNKLGNAYHGPRSPNGQVDAEVLFRGNSQSDITGPYVSQFALLPVNRIFSPVTGSANIAPLSKRMFDQKWQIGSKREFGVSFEDFVAIQNGLIPKPYIKEDFSIDKRYFINGRDIANFWHTDIPFESFYNALYILLCNGFPFSKFLPYYNGTIRNEAGFINMAIVDAFSMIGAVTYEAMKTVWLQKWRVHRTVRPEAFAGLVHRSVVTGINEFSLDSTLFDPELLVLVINKNRQQAQIPLSGYTESQASTFLLSQVYPEGCPGHPSYPSGHAIIAGACVTILKAFFENSILIKDRVPPVAVDVSNPGQLVPLTGPNVEKLTVAGELDKLASNDAFGRNFGGVHYRADADFGIELGELVAINVLQSLGCMYTEQEFKGFEFTRRNGQRIRVTPKSIEILS